MNARLSLIGMLFLMSGVFVSCQLEDKVGESKNFWNSNALTRYKLVGSVHTMLTSYGNYYSYTEFNKVGNPINGYSVINGYGISDTSTWTIDYANGKKIKQTYLQNTRRPSTESITNYEYANTGKYIPQASDLFSGNLYLTASLSAMYNETEREDYTFYGSELWVISSDGIFPNDTTIVQYSGDYPSSFSNRLFECNRIVYANNGNILSYTVLDKYYGRQIVYTYLPDSKYFLLDNVVTTELQRESQTYRLYNYNFRKDLLESLSDEDWSERYSNYAYDKHGNWTSRKFYARPYGAESDWEEHGSSTQKFTYY